MRITPIGTNYYKHKSDTVPQNSGNPSFRGALGPKEFDRIMNMIKSKTRIHTGCSVESISEIQQKWNRQPNFGMLIIKPENLQQLFWKNMPDVYGICIAIGDAGTMAKWTRVLQAETFLVDKNTMLEKLKHFM